ncbi:homeobox-leucine zipper protein ATHB-12-like [Actinidia eriantha]|uniref:homeobox-leucine zipper protein ATHB-12-like n=1 Tax=Actinidia eriantha TaxID=165200 RepID=UPI00258FF573|nr:homeobox-leucine zipper protein ATHB-12-like [Actinidia eriantha]
MKSIRKSKNKNNRRFNDEQIKSLESIFEMESRPELQTKQLLADKLGLQPRQVAIWFQNRRARSKSKLIEQEYGILKSRYNTLASKLDSLKKDNQCLMIQLQRLRNLMEKAQASRNRRDGQIRKSIDEEYDRDTKSTAGGVTNLPSECYKNEPQVPLCYDTSDNVWYFGEETDILNMTQVAPDGSFTSSENWCSFKSCCVLEHPSCNSQRWDLWP